MIKEKITLPGTDLQVSEIIYGCMKLGGSWDDSPATPDNIFHAAYIINTALENGINFFDHADIYTRGKAEKVFGEVLYQNPSLREQMVIQTKCGIRFKGHPEPHLPQRYDFSYNHIINSVNNSLTSLKTDYIDILLLHRPDPLIEPEEVAKAFDELKKSGKVKYFGVSNHNHFQIQLLQKYTDQKLITNQLEFNMVHNFLLDEGVLCNVEKNRNANLFGTLDYCRLNDITIQAYSPFAKGKIAGEEKYSALREKINLYAQKYSVAFETILIAWILRHPARILPVIGTTNIQRITDSTKAVDIKLTREEWYDLYLAARGESLP